MSNELRLRSNFQGGLVEDNPLTDVATTLTSAGLAALPVIDTTNHMALVLDPDGLAGSPEIVWVTAHTAAATTATIVRAKEGTLPREHARDVPFVHAATVADFGFEPWRHHFTPEEEPYSVVGSWIYNDFSGETPIYGNGDTLLISSGAVNDEYAWRVPLSAGTWSVVIRHRKSSNLGIYTFLLDGVSLGTIDGYSASPAAGKDSISFTVSDPGMKTLTMRMATKNASSSSYLGEFSGVTLVRTA